MSKQQLEAVKSKIQELENKQDELTNQVIELTQAIEDSTEQLLLGIVSESDVEQAKVLLNDKKSELAETTELLQRAYAVRKKLAVEKFVPFAKEHREKRLKEIQSRYDNKVESVIAARNELLKQLAELGQIKNEIGNVNQEYNKTLFDLGIPTEKYGRTINERKVYSPKDYTPEELCLGLKTETQERAYSSGRVPAWVK